MFNRDNDFDNYQITLILALGKSNGTWTKLSVKTPIKKYEVIKILPYSDQMINTSLWQEFNAGSVNGASDSKELNEFRELAFNMGKIYLKTHDIVFCTILSYKISEYKTCDEAYNVKEMKI